MISTDEIKIPITHNLTSEYIDNELKKRSINSLHWAIVSVDEKNYILSVSHEH